MEQVPWIIFQGVGMKSGWIEHKGKNIFFCRFSDMDMEALKIEVSETDKAIAQQPENSVYVLTDISNVPGTPEVVSLFKESTINTKKYVWKSAAVGIGFSGPKKILFDLVMKFSGQNVVLFRDLEAAKDWLVSETFY
jgi:hypothetical protein